jgi:hypothetical protein
MPTQSQSHNAIDGTTLNNINTKKYNSLPPKDVINRLQTKCRAKHRTSIAIVHRDMQTYQQFHVVVAQPFLCVFTYF